MTDQIFQFDLDDPQNIVVKLVKNIDWKAERKAFIFHHNYLDLMSTPHFAGFENVFKNQIWQNAKNHAGKYVEGESLTKDECLNSPWNDFFPLNNGKITGKLIDSNGYIVFVGRRFRQSASEVYNKPILFQWTFLEIHDSRMAAQRRIATAFNAVEAIAIPVSALYNIWRAFHWTNQDIPESYLLKLEN